MFSTAFALSWSTNPELLLSDFKKGSSDTLSPSSVEEISVPLSNILPLSFSKRIPSTISLVFSSCSIIVFSFLNNSLNEISPISENDTVWSSWSSSNNILSPMLTENLQGMKRYHSLQEVDYHSQVELYLSLQLQILDPHLIFTTLFC